MTRAVAVWLLDANLLIALTHSAHIHRAEAHAWFAARPKRRRATCALTQLALLRLNSNPEVVGRVITPVEAMLALASMAAQATQEYWPDAPEPPHLVPLQSAALVGHRQVTDAYPLELAAVRNQRIATLDRSLVSFGGASGFSANVELVSAQPLLQQAVTPHRTKRVRSRP